MPTEHFEGEPWKRASRTNAGLGQMGSYGLASGPFGLAIVFKIQSMIAWLAQIRGNSGLA